MKAVRARRMVWTGLLAIALALSLAACMPAEVGAPAAGGPAEPLNTAVSATDVPEPVATVEPSPTAEPTVEPSLTPEPTAEPTQTPSTATVRIFLVALEDGGKTGKAIGCGDSIVPVERQLTVTGDPIVAALEDLLSLGDRIYGESGLYNALYQSNVHVESLAHEGGTVTVHLAGEFALGGVCDDPRAQAQIEETLCQFPGVDAVSVFVNGTPLAQLLSGKG